MTGPGWRVEHRSGTVADLHDLAWPEPLVPTVWVLEPTAPALVLGSTQRDRPVDEAACRSRGVEVVRRRSGGGAVLVEPGVGTWVDVLLPRDDPRWEDDVRRSARWLGRSWVAALASLDVAGAVHGEGMVCGRWGSLVCFAGTGPGEVVAAEAPGGPPAPPVPAGSDGAVPVKLVGTSQRRTRAGARFQSYVHGPGADPGRIVELLAPAVAEEDRGPLGDHLRSVVGTVAAPSGALVDALVRALSTPAA